MAANYKEKKRDLTVIDRLALCGVAVMGRDYALDAYRMSHNIKTENPASLGQMVSRWLNSDKAKAFLNDVKQLYADTLLSNADEGEELSERQLTRIIERGIVTEKDPKRQSDMSLKLMQWRKDAKAEEPERERRSYVLPFVSYCRTCRLMAAYRVVFKDPDIKAEEFVNRAAKEPARMIEESRKAQKAARERILSGKKKSGDNGDSEALGWIFSKLGITIEDCYDIIDFLKRQKEGKNDAIPYWKK